MPHDGGQHRTGAQGVNAAALIAAAAVGAAMTGLLLSGKTKAGATAPRPNPGQPDPVAPPECRYPHAGLLPSGRQEPRIRPDVLIAPVALVTLGVVIDRLRESHAQESITAWLVCGGVAATLLLWQACGYPLIGNLGTLFYALFSFTAFQATSSEKSISETWWYAWFGCMVAYLFLRGVLTCRNSKPEVRGAVTSIYILEASASLVMFLLLGSYSVMLWDADGWTSGLAPWLAYVASLVGIVGALVRFPGRFFVLAIAAAVFALAYALAGYLLLALFFAVGVGFLGGLRVFFATATNFWSTEEVRDVNMGLLLFEEPLPITDPRLIAALHAWNPPEKHLLKQLRRTFRRFRPNRSKEAPDAEVAAVNDNTTAGQRY